MDRRPFHIWEEKYNLINDKSIDGFRYWNYMRRDMVKTFDDEYAEVDPAFYKQIDSQKKEGSISKLKRLIGLCSDKGLKDPGKKEAVFICHPRRIEAGGKLISIYTDYIADRFPDSVTIQWTTPKGPDKKKIYSKNIIYPEKISVMSYIYRYFVKYLKPLEFRRIRDHIFKEMREPFEELSGEYGLHPRPGMFADRAAELYFFYKYKKPRYKAMLASIAPKVIVEVVGGSFDNEIINELAYEMGIPTVELQHGAGALEIWYPDNVRVPQCPQWYFTFGEFWKKGTKPPISVDRILPMGFPYHDMEMSEYPKDTWKSDPKSIIFISGRKYGVDLSAIAAELKKRCPSFRVIYKLHPREYPDYRERYRALENSGVEIIADKKSHLYSLFSECSMQVGVDSTAVYEGMSFGLKTFIWDIPKAVLTKDLTDMGYATLFKDADELIGLVESAGKDTAHYDSNDFFKAGSLDNIERGIRMIMEGSSDHG